MQLVRLLFSAIFNQNLIVQKIEQEKSDNDDEEDNEEEDQDED